MKTVVRCQSGNPVGQLGLLRMLGALGDGVGGSACLHCEIFVLRFVLPESRIAVQIGDGRTRLHTFAGSGNFPAAMV